MYKEHKLTDVKRTKLTSSFLNTFEKRILANPPGVCPISTHIAYLRTARSQTCGKCIPCAKGLEQLENMMQKILDGNGTLDDYVEMFWLAKTIRDTADCAIGYETAYMVLLCINNNKEEYMSHINNHKCQADVSVKVPCMYNCPANVNIPGYIALIGDERYDDAINLIREDNPFPTACAFVCERPCELQCRRTLIDAQINVRGLKRFAVDQIAADKVKTPPRNEATGKKIAVVGGGPSGLTCAYYLSRMGHSVVVYEGKEKLGGMLRYGIPNYRLPKDRLDEDIKAILDVGGIEVKCNIQVGRDISLEALREEYDAVYLSIGAQKGRVIPIENYDNPEVCSAVEMLDRIGHGDLPDFTGKDVVVIGGGNVAMDCARSAIRCHAKSVTLAVREHQEDMTALPSEIQGALEEGVELMTMYAPVKIKVDENGHVISLVTQPQITSNYDANTGMPMVRDADKEQYEIPCNVVFMAIGQQIDSEPFKDYSVEKRGNFATDDKTAVNNQPGLFAGGDCVSGPATAIKAIGAGKIAAINIDEYLGYHHDYATTIDIPTPRSNMRHHMGRVNMTERFARDRKNDFEPVENCMSHEEAMQECSKCLRCDEYGSGCMQGGLI
ncbi:MAG: FAD-dependent oxidoreductase [Lachnospiraceae bacterium]|nr:FAD-dependent oxidoreductase [Candidatus Colinaster equi]